MFLNKKEQILQDLKEGMKQTAVAKKYEVSDAYISQLIKRKVMKQKVKDFDFLKGLIERGAIGIDTSMMSDIEKKHLDEI